MPTLFATSVIPGMDLRNGNALLHSDSDNADNGVEAKNQAVVTIATTLTINDEE
jgi:hypothetical protein